MRNREERISFVTFIDRYAFSCEESYKLTEDDYIKYKSLFERIMLNLEDSYNSVFKIYGLTEWDTSNFEILDKESYKKIQILLSLLVLDTFEFKNKAILKDLEGKTYSQIENKYKRRLNEAQLALVTFEKAENEDCSKEVLKKLLETGA